MSSKKKLIVSLSVAAAVLVAAVIAIVAVFAAANQAVSSNVKVTFRAKNVDCTVAATYQTNTKASAQAFQTIVINAADASKTYEGNVPDVDLEEGGDTGVWLELVYTITNNSSRDMKVTLANFTNENFTVSTGADDLAAGVTIPGKVADREASNDIFTIRITMTDEALKSAEDIVMNVNLAWTLEAIGYTAG